MMTQKEIEKLNDEELEKLRDLIIDELYARLVTIPDIQKKIRESGNNE